MFINRPLHITSPLILSSEGKEMTAYNCLQTGLRARKRYWMLGRLSDHHGPEFVPVREVHAVVQKMAWLRPFFPT